MSLVRRCALILASLCIALSFAAAAHAQQYPQALLSGLHWRDVGPMRAGRSYAVAGVFVVRLIPAVLFGPIAGVAADRLDRRQRES